MTIKERYVALDGTETFLDSNGTVSTLTAAQKIALGSGSAASGSSAFQSLENISGATSINLANGPNISFTVSAASSLTFTNTPSNNTAQRVVLTITNGGAFAITWPAGIRWLGAGIVGSTPTLVSSGVEKIVIDIINNQGTLIYDASYVGRVA